MEQKKLGKRQTKKGSRFIAPMVAAAITAAVALGATGCEQSVGAGIETPSDNPSLPVYNNGAAPISVDTLRIIGDANGGNSAVHGLAGLADGESNVCNAARYGLLPALSSQAEALHTFFADAAATYPSLADKFNSLRAAEAIIQNKANQTYGLTTYHTTVDQQVRNILNTIFTNDADRAEFNRYFEAYRQGQYLVTADWNTRPDIDVTLSENAFKDARQQIIAYITPTADEDGMYAVGRNMEDLKIGDTDSVTLQFADMKRAMKNQIVSALGLTGVANADNMAEALVIQLGKDNEGFRAFVRDLQEEGLNTALNLDYTDYGYSQVASADAQSGAKLASVKDGAYGGKYTGNFTPYNKKGMA